MNKQHQPLWPFKPQRAFLSSIGILLFLLIGLIVTKSLLQWPSQEMERMVFLGVFILAVLPILLRFVDVVMDRGAVVDVKGIKFDFSQMQTMTLSDVTIPANAGIRGQNLEDSNRQTVVNTLRRAVTNDIVVVDLEEGQAWWETRLLILLAGAVRHNKPKIVVFVGTEGNVKRRYQGWATAEALLPYLLKADSAYLKIYHEAMAVNRQWGLVEPPDAMPPPMPAWITTQRATNAGWDAFDNKLPNPFLAEKLLADELRHSLEQNQNHRPPEIGLVRLEALFKAVLRHDEIDLDWSSKQQLDAFFSHDAPYVAMTQNGQYQALAARISILNALVGELVKKG